MLFVSFAFIPNAEAESSRPSLLENNSQYEDRIKRDRNPYSHNDSILKDNRYNDNRTYPRTRSSSDLLLQEKKDSDYRRY